jgi:hypothetical protein
MNLLRVRKNGGTIVHWKEFSKGRALCGANHGNRNIGRSCWVIVLAEDGQFTKLCSLCLKRKAELERLP